MAGDLKRVVEDLQKKLHDTKQTFQPILLAEGRLVDVKKFHIVINDQYYEKKTFIEALEFALKSYFALDLSYPLSSNTL